MKGDRRGQGLGGGGEEGGVKVGVRCQARGSRVKGIQEREGRGEARQSLGHHPFVSVHQPPKTPRSA